MPRLPPLALKSIRKSSLRHLQKTLLDGEGLHAPKESNSAAQGTQDHTSLVSEQKIYDGYATRTQSPTAIAKRSNSKNVYDFIVNRAFAHRYTGSDAPRYHVDQTTTEREGQWIQSIDRLRVSYGAGWLKKARDPNLNAKDIFSSAGMSASFVAYNKSRSRVRRKLLYRSWKALDDEQRESHMLPALLLALNDSPSLALRMLRDLSKIDDIHIPHLIIHDVIHQAGMALLCRTDTVHSGHRIHHQSIKTVFRMAMFALEKWRHAPHSVLNAALVRVLSQRLDAKQFKELVECVTSERTNLSTASLVHLLERCESLGMIYRMFKLIHQLPKSAWNTFRVHTFIAKLITARRNRNWQISASKRLSIFRRLLEFGVVPSDSLRNTTIKVAMESGDSGLAWQVYHRSHRDGLKPTSATFSSLLCQRVEQPDEILDVLDMALAHGCVDLGVAQSAIRALARYQLTRTWNDKYFQTALALYSRVFDPSPLHELGLLDGHTQRGSLKSVKLYPRPSIMSFMLRAFCQQHSGREFLWTYYQRFMRMALSGHRLFKVCAMYPYVSEAFMMGTRGNTGMLMMCTEVMQDMLDDVSPTKYSRLDHDNGSVDTVSEPSVDDREFDSGCSAVTPTPTERRISKPRGLTWNILLYAILEARDYPAADKVLALMKERGYEPTTATWNTLIRAHTYEQNIEATVDLVEGMERAGRQADEYTKRSLGGIANRDALIRALDEALKRRNHESTELTPSQIEWG